MNLFHNITLELEDIRDFFIKPVPYPFSEHANYNSGIEQIISDLNGTDLKSAVRTTIFLPEDKEIPERSEFEAALRRYCKNKIRQNENETSAIFQLGRKSLYTALLCILALLLITPVLDNLKAAGELGYLPNFLMNYISIGITLLSWISMWYPIEVFLYRWWPFRRENQILEKMMKMDISVKHKR